MTATTDSLSDSYALRLKTFGGVWWKRWLDVQAPYRWNLRRLRLGYVLDVGCGIGRNLLHLNGNGIGIDPNPACVTEARNRGLVAYTPEEYFSSERAKAERFDSLVIAHVLEHMPGAEARELICTYRPLLKPGGRIVLITPQMAGFRSDPTHVEYVDGEKLRGMAEAAGFTVDSRYTFPFPAWVGAFFKHNEFVVTGHLSV